MLSGWQQPESVAGAEGRREGALSWLPKILYLVGWVRRGDTFDDKLITFAPRRNPPEDYL